MKKKFMKVCSVPVLLGTLFAIQGCEKIDGSDSSPKGEEQGQLPITEAAHRDFADIHDLRGLRFAKDGKIYASGHTDADPSHRRVVVVRLMADGTLDPSFGDKGKVILELSESGGEQSIGIVELGNSDIIIQANVPDGQGGDLIADTNGGESVPRQAGQNVVLVRLTSTGEFVRSFGNQGIAQVDFGWTSAANANWPMPTYNSGAAENARWSWSGYPIDVSWGIELDATGAEEKIVVFGSGPALTGSERVDNDRYVVRVRALDGKVDPAFNNGQAYTFDTLQGLSDGGRRGIVEADGSIVSGGYTNFGPNLGNHVVLLRLNADGTPDTSFGFDTTLPGVAIFNPFVDDGGMAECYAVAKQSSGRYVTTGYGRATGAGFPSSLGFKTTEEFDLVSFGIMPSSLDTSYGHSGALALQSEGKNLTSTQDRGRMLVVLPDDRVVHVGRFGDAAAIFVTLPDGTLDVNQGKEGMFTYPHATIKSHFYAAALSPDGRRIAATTGSDAVGAMITVLEVGK